MAGRESMPDLMTEALGDLRIPPRRGTKVVAINGAKTAEAKGAAEQKVVKRLAKLRLRGMAQALEEQAKMTGAETLPFEERLSLLLERESRDRAEIRLKSRLTRTRARYRADLDQIDYTIPRGLDQSLMAYLAGCAWIDRPANLIITGPAGVGKSFITSVLVRQACIKGYRSAYRRLPDLLQEMDLAREEGRLEKMFNSYARLDLLALDDWGVRRLTTGQAEEMLEFLERRYDAKATIFTGQPDVDSWPDLIHPPHLAEAVIDRIVPKAEILALFGPSLRNKF